MRLRIRRILQQLILAALCAFPLALSAAPAAYITNASDNTVSVVDLTSFTVTQTIPVGPAPFGVAVHPSRPRVYITNHGASTVSVIDTHFNTVVDTVTVGNGGPYSIVLDPTGTHAYVGNDTNSISVINTATETPSLFAPGITAIRGLAIDPAGTQLFIGRVFFNTMEVASLTGNPNIHNFTDSQEAGAAGVTVDANNNVFWADSSSGLIRSQTIGTNNARNLATGQQSANVVAVDGTNVYWTITSATGTVMSEVKTATAPSPLPATLASGLNLPAGIAVDASYVYVAISGGNTLLRISKSSAASNSVIVGNGPEAIGNFIGDNTAFADDATITLSGNPATSVYGQNVVLTATLSAAFSGGTVNFCDGGPANDAAFCQSGTPLCSGAVNVTGNTAACTTNTLAPGAHNLTARYNGTGFTSTTPTVLNLQVDQAATTAVVTSDVNPSTLAQTVSFIATVGATAPGTGTPTGPVNFFDGTTLLGTASLDAGGQATFSTSTLGIGTHSITAVYAGDTNFVTSTSLPLTQTVNKAAATTTLTSGTNPSTFGQSVTFTAGVTAPSGTPTGTVSFLDGATTLATVALNGSGQATFSTSTLTAGSHSITASYLGDANFAAGNSPPITQTVNLAATETALTSSLNPSAFGQSVTFTASVTAPSGTPTGTVSFLDGTSNLGTATLNDAGQATFSTAALAAGSHTITANYSGDANFGASSATLTQTVNAAVSTTTLTVDPTRGIVGQTITLAATVTSNSGTPTATVTSTAVASTGGSRIPMARISAVPTGNVTFLDGTTTLASVALTNGQATFSTNTLAAGTHTLVANYAGGPGTGASSASVVLIVDPAAAASITPAPTLHDRALILLGLLMAAIGMMSRRHARR